MTKNPDILETIEAFVEGKLKPEERIAFEQKCLANPELSAFVDEYRLLRIGMEEVSRNDLRAKLRSWDEALVQKDKIAFSFFKIAAAVFCIAIIGLIIALLLNKQDQEASKIAQTYFIPYPNMMGERNAAASSAVDSLLHLYDKGQFNEVVEEFETRIKADGADEGALMRFYLGESLLAAGEYQRAAEVLETFSERENALFDVARFHRALALTMAGDDDKARRALYIIHAEKGPYREKAGELLKHFGDAGSDETNIPLE
jgi:hypothetical protein